MSASDIEVILYRIQDLTNRVEEIRTDLKEMNTRLCPKPGACVVMESQLAEVTRAASDREARVRALEADRNKAKGVAGGLRIAWALGGGLAGIIATAITVWFAK